MIEEKEYKARRDKLAAKLQKDSVAIVFSAEQKIRSNDTEYPYRQDSNFYYLTGFKEDKAALVFVKKKKSVQSYLFVEKKDPALELWHGKRIGAKVARKKFKVDNVFEIETLSKKIEDFLQKKTILYYDFSLDYSKVKLLKKHAKGLSTYHNLAKFIEKMRLIKSDTEIALIKKAIEITTEAHQRAMTLEKSTKSEYQLQAEIEYIFKKNGAYSDAYTSIVACGNAANTLHYVENNKALVDGQLILIDAGCEYQYYASDITRTIPVSGKFSKAQKELYNMVLDVQIKIIQMIKPGVKRSKLQKSSVELLTQGLLELGILKGDLKTIIKEEGYKKYYPHGIGHWMGIDVHDQCPYKDENDKEIPLKKGMVLTIEPAIYIDEADKSVVKKYRGIGIRIEDDILVTQTGFENLSSGIVKAVEDVEELFSISS